MLSGSLPTADSQGGRQIAVGRYREEQVETRGDSAYFLADNEEYQVTGVIGTKQSDALDGYLVTNYHSLNGRQRRALGKPTLLLRFQSDIRDVEPYVQQAAEQIWKADPSANLDSHRTSQAVDGSVYIEESLKQYPFYMYIFCICIFIMISRQWGDAERERTGHSKSVRTRKRTAAAAFVERTIYFNRIGVCLLCRNQRDSLRMDESPWTFHSSALEQSCDCGSIFNCNVLDLFPGSGMAFEKNTASAALE